MLRELQRESREIYHAAPSQHTEMSRFNLHAYPTFYCMFLKHQRQSFESRRSETWYAATDFCFRFGDANHFSCTDNLASFLVTCQFYILDLYEKRQQFVTFIFKSVIIFFLWVMWTLTTFSLERSTPSFPKRTWKGEHWNVPSGCRTTITSMQPDRVAWLIPLYNSFTVTSTWPASCPT